jgi:hypothetical protein
MGDVPPAAFHRREAARYFRLAELSHESAVKQQLARIAGLHMRFSAEIEATARAGNEPNGSRPNLAGRAQHPYRLLLLGCGQVGAVHDFQADTDIAALALAIDLSDACSDLYDRFELWQDLRLICRSADGRGPKRPPHFREITAQMQESVLQSQETLLRSCHAIAQSRKLLIATERLRLHLTGRPDAAAHTRAPAHSSEVGKVPARVLSGGVKGR